MATARDIVESSLRLIGALASGESASAAQASDAFTSLNEMIASWSTEELIIPYITEESFTLTAAQGQYSMGDGASDFDTARPLRFESAAIVDGSSITTDVPVKILNSKQWAEILGKTQTSTIPMYMYPEGTYPNETLKFWPIPSETKTVKLWTQKVLVSFTNLSTTVSLPPGYNRALRYNLAIEISPEYGMSPAPEVFKIAGESKANVKRKNIRPTYLKADAATLQRNGRNSYSLLTGE